MRHVFNFFITGALMLVFQWIGWISLVHAIAPFAIPFLNQLVLAGIVGLIFTVGMWLANKVFALFVIITFGLGCFFYPVYVALIGAAGFWAISVFLPGWITLNATTLQIILMGCLASLIRIHDVSSARTSTTSSDDD